VKVLANPDTFVYEPWDFKEWTVIFLHVTEKEFSGESGFQKSDCQEICG